MGCLFCHVNEDVLSTEDKVSELALKFLDCILNLSQLVYWRLFCHNCQVRVCGCCTSNRKGSCGGLCRLLILTQSLLSKGCGYSSSNWYGSGRDSWGKFRLLIVLLWAWLMRLVQFLLSIRLWQWTALELTSAPGSIDAHWSQQGRTQTGLFVRGHGGPFVSEQGEHSPTRGWGPPSTTVGIVRSSVHSICCSHTRSFWGRRYSFSAVLPAVSSQPPPLKQSWGSSRWGKSTGPTSWRYLTPDGTKSQYSDIDVTEASKVLPPLPSYH